MFLLLVKRFPGLLKLVKRFIELDLKTVNFLSVVTDVAVRLYIALYSTMIYDKNSVKK